MFPLNPILLYLGIAAVSVPVVIHLLNRTKVQKVTWAAMRFLKISVAKNQRRMQIEDMILLALRCLLVFLLGLALSRPLLNRAAGSYFGSPATAVIILDNSYSMGMSDGEATRMDKAKKALSQVMDALPNGSSSALILASDNAVPVIHEPTLDLNLVRKMVKDAPLSDRGTDLAPALNRAIAILDKSIGQRKEIFLVTDGQSSGWRHFSEMLKSLEGVRKDILAHLIFINEHADYNLAVSDLTQDSVLVPARQSIRFSARISNFGKEPARDVRVSIHVDNEPPSDEFTISSLPPGASQTISLLARFRTEGYHAVTANISEDRLPADDQRSIAVRAIKEMRILLVDGNPGSEARDSEVLFLHHALLPVSPEDAASYYVKAATISSVELNNARLDDHDVVVLANVATLTPATADHLAHFVRRGGGLVVFPGERMNTQVYNELLGNAKLLPARFGPLAGNPGQDTEFFTFQDKNYEHAVVSLWNDPANGNLSSARFFRAYDLAPIAPPAITVTNRISKEDIAPPNVILRFSNGKPAIMERNFGFGRVIQFASTASSSWNDFPVRPSYVPLMHRLMGYLMQKQDVGLNIPVGSRFIRRVPTDLLGKDAAILKPRLKSSPVRDTRRIEMVDGWACVQYDSTDNGGVYEVAIGEPPLSLKFAVQPECSESFLDELSSEQKKMLSQIAQCLDWNGKISLKDQMNDEHYGAEIWFPLLLAALILAILEFVLGQYFSRSR